MNASIPAARTLLHSLRADWPAWLAIAFVALIPFRRHMELPLLVFALSLAWLWRSPVYRPDVRQAAPFVLGLFACFWIPVLVSSFDSYRPQHSWLVTVAGLRYAAAALAIAVLLRAPGRRRLALTGMAAVLGFWVLDGIVQLLFGRDLFGFAAHPDRLNALFGERFQFYGPLLAMLSPLALEFVRRRCPTWVFIAAFGLIFVVVLLAGMRAGWLAMGLLAAFYTLAGLRSGARAERRAALLLPLLVAGLLAGAWAGSEAVRERVALSLRLAEGSVEAVDRASSWRLPIWRAALKMYAAHPVNGVGARAYPVAYYDFAPADDIHVVNNPAGNGGAHAHNIVLEAMADTGSLGLLGLLLAYGLGVRTWLRMGSAERQEALPYALCLGLLAFPLNTHFATLGVTTSSLIWFCVGLLAACRRDA